MDTSQNFYDLPADLFVKGLEQDRRFDQQNNLNDVVIKKYVQPVNCLCHFFTVKDGLQTVNLGVVNGTVRQERRAVRGY